MVENTELEKALVNKAYKTQYIDDEIARGEIIEIKDKISKEAIKYIDDLKSQIQELEKEFELCVKKTAQEILEHIADFDDGSGLPFKAYTWFQNLCKKYSIEIAVNEVDDD